MVHGTEITSILSFLHMEGLPSCPWSCGGGSESEIQGLQRRDLYEPYVCLPINAGYYIMEKGEDGWWTFLIPCSDYWDRLVTRPDLSSIVILEGCNMHWVTHEFHQRKAKEGLAPYAFLRSCVFRAFAPLLAKAGEFGTQMITFMISVK